MSVLEKLVREQISALNQTIRGKLRTSHLSPIILQYEVQTDQNAGLLDSLPIYSMTIKAEETVRKRDTMEQMFTEWRQRNDQYGDYTHIRIGSFDISLDGARNKDGFCDIYIQTNQEQAHKREIETVYDVLKEIGAYKEFKPLEPALFAFFPRHMQMHIATTLLHQGTPFHMETMENGLGPARIEEYKLTETEDTYTFSRTARMGKRGIIRKGLMPEHIQELEKFITSIHPIYTNKDEWKLAPAIK